MLRVGRAGSIAVLSLLVSAAVVPASAFGQSRTAVASDTNGNNLWAYFYEDGEPESGAHLLLSYSMAIRNIRSDLVDTGRLREIVEGMFPELFPDARPGDSDEAYSSAHRIAIEFDLVRRKRVYARCSAPRNSYGYGFGATSSTDGAFYPYVSLGSNSLYVNKIVYYGQKKPFRICRAKGKVIEPAVKVGDTVILRQDRREVLRGKFKKVNF